MLASYVQETGKQRVMKRTRDEKSEERQEVKIIDN